MCICHICSYAAWNMLLAYQVITSKHSTDEPFSRSQCNDVCSTCHPMLAHSFEVGSNRATVVTEAAHLCSLGQPSWRIHVHCFVLLSLPHKYWTAVQICSTQPIPAC